MQAYQREVRQRNISLQLTALFRKLFKILSHEIIKAKFGFSSQTLVCLPLVMFLANVNFRAMQRFKTYERFDRENNSGCKVSPR